jgi:hypothetical protein
MPLGQVELRRRGEQRDATARGAGTSAESMPCMCGARGAGSGSEGAAAAEVRPLSARYVEARRPCGRGRRGGLRATLSVLVLGRRSAGSESDRRPAATGGESGRGRAGLERAGGRRATGEVLHDQPSVSWNKLIGEHWTGPGEPFVRPTTACQVGRVGDHDRAFEAQACARRVWRG